MSWKLFLDVERFPRDISWLVARSVDEALALIAKRGYPMEMSLDYDFGENNPNGFDFLKTLTDEVMRGWPNLDIPAIGFDCQSNDIDGRCRILGLWKSFQNKLGRRNVSADSLPMPASRGMSADINSENPSPAHLVVAISSRALFNLDESHAVFENEGVEAYCRYQMEREEIPLEPGVAFSLVKKLLALNELDPTIPRVEVILLSRNNADTGLRIFNSIKHHHLNISRAAFTRGESTHPYISAFGAQLFLSAEPGVYARHWKQVSLPQPSLPRLPPTWRMLIPHSCASLSMVMRYCFLMILSGSTNVMDWMRLKVTKNSLPNSRCQEGRLKTSSPCCTAFNWTIR
jgi:hypothetical protein